MARKSSGTALAMATPLTRLGVVATPVGSSDTRKVADPAVAHDTCLAELETHLNAAINAFESEDLELEDFTDDS